MTITQTHRDMARENLRQAENLIGEALVTDFSATAALIGIGYAVLEVADAIRDRTHDLLESLK